jgi:DNA-directed RNA polymerase specialized sigma24 family protein
MVLDTLAGLDDQLCAVLLAHDLDEIRMEEVAEQQGLPLSTAYKVRLRALKRAREVFEKRAGEEQGTEPR